MQRSMLIRPFYLLVLLSTILWSAEIRTKAQDLQPLTLETVTHGGVHFRNFYPSSIYGVHWFADGFVYYKADGDYHTACLYTPQQEAPRAIYTSEQLTTLLAPYGDTAQLPPLVALDYTPHHSYLQVELEGNRYLVDIRQGVIVGYFATKGIEEKDLSFSPDEQHLAVKASDGRLLIYSLQTAGSTPLQPQCVATDEDEASVVYGTSVHQNEFGIEGGLYWSPDSKVLAFYRMDQSMVAPYPIVDITPHKGEVSPVRYPMAGDPSHHVTLGLYDLASSSIRYLNTGGDPEHYLTNIAWHPNGQEIYIAEINRGQDYMQLNGYSVKTGERTRTILEERDEHYVEPLHPMMFVPNGRNNQFVWESRREGFRQLYLYDLSGRLVRKLTSEAGEITDLYGFDPQGRRFFYQTAYPSPMDRQIFSTDLRTGRTTQLTQESGTHTAFFSPDKKYFIDHMQSAQVARRFSLIDERGRVIRSIYEAEDPSNKYDMPHIEQGTLLAADGKTSLYYRLITPSHMKPETKYPTIVYVYGGPHAQLVTNTPQWGASGWDIYMAQQSYVIFTVDGRGSAERGAAFEQVIHRQVGTNEMADQMEGVRFLKSLPYVDENRIGVYGWSFGGFMATNLMLSHPETFKVGVAGGPVMDWSRYEIMYGERYNDHPAENQEGYQKNNLIQRAKDLKGRLLLIHGTADNVVLWQHAQCFVQSAITERTYPDLYYYPGHLHNVLGRDRVHLNHIITRYFQDFL